MTHVYDKAKWHFNGDFPEDLDIEQGYVHTGLFLTWLAKNKLLSEWLEKETPEPIADARSGVGSPIGIYKVWDGALVEDMLSEKGNAFAKDYFDMSNPKFLVDYMEEFDLDNASVYRVEPSWESYDRIAMRIDRAFREFSGAAPKRF